MVLRVMNEFVMTYDLDFNDHNIHALMNDIACEYERKLLVLSGP